MEKILKKIDDLYNYTCEANVQLFALRQQLFDIREDLHVKIQEAKKADALDKELDGAPQPSYGEKLDEVRKELKDPSKKQRGRPRKERK